MKAPSPSIRKNQNGAAPKATLFLGQKVLGELRILMRLASPVRERALNGIDPSPSY